MELNLIKRSLNFSLAIILFCINSAFAQLNVQEASYKGGNKKLWDFLGDNLTKEIKVHNVEVCLTSVTFAQFTINKYGDVDSILFYEQPQTPPVFKLILTSIIKATNGHWLPKTVNGEAVESKPFLLPLLYEMEAGCYSNGKRVGNSTYTALRGLLGYDFDSNGNYIKDKLYQLDCTLLRPLSVFSAN